MKLFLSAGPVVADAFGAIESVDLRVLYALNHYRIRALDPLLLFVTDSTYILCLLVPTVILLYGLLARKRRWIFMGLQVFAAYLASAAVVTALKHCYLRERPFVAHPFIDKIASVNSPSFPSGHTADAFSIGVSIALLAGGNRKIIIPVLLWASLVAYSRMALGVHYPFDVLTSMVIASSLALLAYRLFYRLVHSHEKI